MSAEKKAGGDNPCQDNGVRPDRGAVVALASSIRTFLRFQQQLGVAYYPLTPGLQRCLARKEKKPVAAQHLKRVGQPFPPSRPEKPHPVSLPSPPDQLAFLQRDIENCRLCALASARQGQVVGTGTVAPRLLVIGDYSSQENGFSPATLFSAAEDAMLWNMIRAIGLAAADVYVTNTVKCCPLAARPPESASEQRCLAYLRREIELIRPQVICAMGEVAAHSVLGGDDTVLRLRGRLHPYQYGGETGGSLPVMVTFHPRFLLKHADFKKAAWEDLQMIQRQLQAR